MSSIISPTAKEDRPLTQFQKDGLLVQRLQESIFPTTIYLSDDFKSKYLISAENVTSPYPSPQQLPILTIHNNPANKTIKITHVLLPRTLHPLLSRYYAPSREIEKAGTLPKTTHWVGFDLKFMQRYKEGSDFITALDHAMEIGGMAFIVDDPADAPVKAFMMEIRGMFRGEDDILASAQRQVHVLGQMVFGKYFTLGPEVLGWNGEGKEENGESGVENAWPMNVAEGSVSKSRSRKASSVNFWFQ
ncbi:uncharacterized protein N7473_002692 [Penicillium subrubescens]|nr:uncharacterized protein N7473_002692 [Penicillium subrubescens]KAJ5905776.1 hypothetical protein N7473_002692 [Penicillium subrubescens]